MHGFFVADANNDSSPIAKKIGPALLPAQGFNDRKKLEAEPRSKLALKRPRQVRAGRVDKPNCFAESLGIVG